MKNIQSIMNAFADCHMDWEQGSKIRNLNFKAEQTLTLGQLKEVLPKAIPDGYNEFDAVKIVSVLQETKTECLYTVAREGSPALYIHGSPKDLAKIKKAAESLLCVDEIGIQNDKTLRLWWD